jgi:hypothetical protein
LQVINSSPGDLAPVFVRDPGGELAERGHLLGLDQVGLRRLPMPSRATIGCTNSEASANRLLPVGPPIGSRGTFGCHVPCLENRRKPVERHGSRLMTNLGSRPQMTAGWEPEAE